MLMFVVVGGLITAYIGKRLLATEEKPPVVRTRNIPTPLGDLEPGMVVTEAHLGVAPIRVTDLEADMLVSTRGIVGRVVRERIPALSSIRANQLFPVGEHPPLEVEKGMRAVSIGLSENVAIVDGLLRPGQFADVHFTPENIDRFGGLTMTLFRGVKVIAINRSYVPASVEDVGNTVTFELTPEQSNILLLARGKGDISLTYNPEGKGNGGVTIGRDDRATLDEILGLEPEPKPPVPVPPFESSIYRQTDRSTHFFRDDREIERPSAAPTDNNPSSGSPDDPDDHVNGLNIQAKPKPKRKKARTVVSRTSTK
jgi:pilus assembly protein CpaB